MRITVRTIGRLSGHLPAGRAPECELKVAPETDLVAVMAALGLSTARDYLVIRNGRPIATAAQAGVVVAEGDRLTILPKPKVG